MRIIGNMGKGLEARQPEDTLGNLSSNCVVDTTGRTPLNSWVN